MCHNLCRLSFAVLNLEYSFHNPLPNRFSIHRLPLQADNSHPQQQRLRQVQLQSLWGGWWGGRGLCGWWTCLGERSQTRSHRLSWRDPVFPRTVGWSGAEWPGWKNDGSVNGVRYFECQPLQGIFTRPSKLTRQPIGDGSDEQQQNAQLQGGAGASGQRVVMPLREGMLNSSVKTGNESGSNMSDSGSVKKGGEKDLKVGDRVLVSVGSFSQRV